MRPSPFAGKLKKKQIKIDKDNAGSKQKQEKEDDFNPTQPENYALKPPSTKNLMRLPKSIGKQKQKSRQEKKSPENIDRDEQQPQKLQTKASTSFKPNLKLKSGTGKKLKITTHHQQGSAQIRKQQEPQQPQTQYRPVLKPNLLRKGQPIVSQRSSYNREQVVMGDPDSPKYPQNSHHNNNNGHNNGNTIGQEDSHQGSGSYTHSISMAPKYKIKKHEPQFQVIQQQPMEQTGFGVTNFADLKIQTREINVDTTQIKVSEVKKEKQQARVRQLSKLLNLQVDLYQETLNISCITAYEIYINKIKSGSLINSSDQAFDEKTTSSSQTAFLEYEDFTNQCPQDFHTDASNIIQRDQTEMFNQFVTRIAPVLQQLIKPANTIVMPPIFLLALRPQFRKLVTCPYPVFIYYSNQLQLGIGVVGEKLYIVENQIQTVVSVGSNLVGGCRDGTICVWTGKNDRRSRLYRKIQQHTQTTNFELPQSTSHDLDRFSIYRSSSPIVSLFAQSSQQFCSLDSSCKMIKWRINRLQNLSKASATPIIQPYISYQFVNMIQRPNLVGYSLKKRNDKYFINSSAGILVWNGDQIIQRLDTQGLMVWNLALPHRTNFIYAACEDSSIRIYEEHYANQLFKIYIPGASLSDIFIPETQFQNKKLSLNSQIYISTKQGTIYSLNLLKNSTEPRLLTQPHSQKKDRDVIYRGVNRLQNGFQLVSLWRDLKCTSQIKKMDVNTEPTVNNIKNIIEDNRQMHTWLQAENCLTITE